MNDHPGEVGIVWPPVARSNDLRFCCATYLLTEQRREHVGVNGAGDQGSSLWSAAKRSDREREGRPGARYATRVSRQVVDRAQNRHDRVVAESLA